MQGGKNTRPNPDRRALQGYTILEVMLFMAISGVMFIVSATFISGKQGTAEFRQGINTVNQQILTVVNQVANGEYESLGNNNCTASTASNAAPTIQVGSIPQGSNGGRGGCIFLGKVIYFPYESGVSTDKFVTYTVTARQTDAVTGDSVATFAAANPIVIDSRAAGSVNLTTSQPLVFGLEMTDAFLCTGACSAASPRVAAFGFMGSFGGYASTSTSNESSAQQILTLTDPLSYSSPARSETDMAIQLNSQMRTMTSSNIITGNKSIQLCFRNNTRYGTVTIGGTGGQQLTTTMEIGLKAPCSA